MLEPMLFGAWLRLRRRALDLTRESLAHIVGCASVTLKKIEADERKPSRILAERLADALVLNGHERIAFLQAARTGTMHATAATIRQPTTIFRVQQLSGLPIPPTPFIGRRRELAQLRAYFTTAHVRLVTIIGPPGVGKTRLALAYAMSGYSTERVIFVSLAEYQAAEQLGLAIAQALKLRLTTSSLPTEQLITALNQEATLLVLDNFEHLLAASALIAQLLAQIASLRVLVSSRLRLQLRGEHLLTLQPLGLPPENRIFKQPAGRVSDSERLFLQLARAIHPDFRLQEHTAAYVAEICRRLDGLPLAIELAVARLADYDLETILIALRKQLDILSDGPRDLPQHQHSMEAAFRWSYVLLSPYEQKIFRYCAVLVGSFDSSILAALCSSDELDEIQQTLDVLVQAQLLHSNTYRYTMLESIRMYARHLLEQAYELVGLEQKLMEWAMLLTNQARTAFVGKDQQRWFECLDFAIANVRLALSIAQRRQSKEALLTIAANLFYFWQSRGLYPEGLQWLEQGFSMSTAITNHPWAFAYHIAGTIAQEMGQIPRALVYQQEALKLVQPLNNSFLASEILNNTAISYMRSGEYEQAMLLLRQAIGLAEDTQHLHILGHANNNRGLIAMEQGEYEQAEAYYCASMYAFQQHEDWRGCAFPLNNWAEMAVLCQNTELARLLLDEAAQLWEVIGERWGLNYVNCNQAWLCIHQGILTKARDKLLLALEGFVKTEEQRNILGCCEAAAALAICSSNRAAAMLLVRATADLRQKTGHPIIPVEQERLQKMLAPVPSQSEVELELLSQKAPMSFEELLAFTFDTLRLVK